MSKSNHVLSIFSMKFCKTITHSHSYPAAQDANFSTAVELAVRFGKTLIIQEMDKIEPVLYPLLRADLISQGIT